MSILNILSLSGSVSAEYAKKLRHAYLASVSYIDAQFGKLWSELKTLELEKNTIIVIWGDHGWHLGDQLVWGKHTLFENALKSTLIIKSPFKEHQSKKMENIIETVDIYPTLLKLCGIQIEHKIDGQSFFHGIKNQKVNTDSLAYSYFKNGISLRTPQYRLTKYFRTEEPTVKLYDHTQDPNEITNIALEEPQIIAHLMPLLEKGNTDLYTK